MQDTSHRAPQAGDPLKTGLPVLHLVDVEDCHLHVKE